MKAQKELGDIASDKSRCEAFELTLDDFNTTVLEII